MVQNKIFKNAAWIIACKIIQAILGLLVTMLSARYLGPSGYGLINYAASIVAFVAPIMQVGLNSILVQELINTPEKEGETLGTALTMSFISSLFCVLGVIAFTAFVNYGEKDTIIVCGLYSLLLIFQALEMLQYWFQAKLKSKYVSIVMLIAYVVVSIYQIFLLIRGMPIYWFAVSKAFDYMLIAGALFIIYKKLGGDKFSFSWIALKKLFAKSKYYIVSSMMVTIFAQTDKIMIKLMIDDAATGYYSAATTCAGITTFIFSAIIDSFRPVIFERKKIGQKNFEKIIIQLYSIIIYLSLLQCIVITLFSPLIVNILYGVDYSPTIGVLRIVVWYTTFSYLGSVRNIWILANEKQKYLWVLNLFGALANVILNFILIPSFEIMGAALASLITQIFTNIFMNYIIKPIRPVNRLMLKGLTPKVLIQLIKDIKK